MIYLFFLDNVKLTLLLDEAASHDGLIKFLEKRGIASHKYLYLLIECAKLEVLLGNDLVLLPCLSTHCSYLL